MQTAEKMDIFCLWHNTYKKFFENKNLRNILFDKKEKNVSKRKKEEYMSNKKGKNKLECEHPTSQKWLFYNETKGKPQIFYGEPSASRVPMCIENKHFTGSDHFGSWRDGSK